MTITTWKWSGSLYGLERKPPDLPLSRYVHPADAPRELVIEAPFIQLSFQRVRWTHQQKDEPSIVRRKYSDTDRKDETYKIRRQDGLHAILPITENIVARAYVCMDVSVESMDGRCWFNNRHVLVICSLIEHIRGALVSKLLLPLNTHTPQ